ncbi:MAG TPA: carbon monoxide dehydrogenase subunit G [Alphaproteobacteria bacterium]|nr:carbon monoxide dehydrogenase subunit G [Alphaproteobacteria bacterium]
MDMTGEYRIAAPRERVWAALNDPAILKQCIPGCQELEKTGENGFKAKVVAKVGPVSANFTGNVTLSDLDPPKSYKISGEGSGGAAGFARGGAEVSLEADGPVTLLRYKVQANVGGKLAQIGSRLIDGSAKKLSEEFFGNFARLVGEAEAPAEAPAAASAQAPAPGAPASAKARTLSPAIWIGAVVVAIIVLLVIFAG